MESNLNTKPSEQKPEQQGSPIDELFKRAENARLEALRAFYSKAKRLADDKARDR